MGLVKIQNCKRIILFVYNGLAMFSADQNTRIFINLNTLEMKKENSDFPQNKALNIGVVIGSFPMASPKKIFERLVELYPNNYVCVAKICDEVLDRSGALLGEVRNAVRK